MGGAGGIGKSGGGGGTISSSMQTPFWTRAAAREMDKPMAGGMAGGNHLADGGLTTGNEMPWWERQDARIADIPFHGGLIGGSGGGRTDQIPMSVPSGSHVLPADSVSGAGQNATQSGALNIIHALRIGPWGVPDPQEIKGHGPPHAPAAVHLPGESGIDEAKRGGTSGPRRVSVLVASGEIAIPDDDWVDRDAVDGKLYLHRGVRSLGRDHRLSGKQMRGKTDSEMGHDLLDGLIKRIRDFNIKWLKSAPPPKK
jgi:hypothetical protein